ncbi:DUF397 domain-containing protein [Streptomyces sp. NPDC051162]|uniref:DUF397 domain-containing protein n=1 Tax=Streptomyces sp. NPDC051162 TaxID=3154747 RepID=UPI00344335C7
MTNIDSPPGTAWHKSSYSNDNGDCVEWAPAFAEFDIVPVRDSKNPHGHALMFTPGAWSAFVGAVRQEDLRPA